MIATLRHRSRVSLRLRVSLSLAKKTDSSIDGGGSEGRVAKAGVGGEDASRVDGGSNVAGGENSAGVEERVGLSIRVSRSLALPSG